MCSLAAEQCSSHQCGCNRLGLFQLGGAVWKSIHFGWSQVHQKPSPGYPELQPANLSGSLELPGANGNNLF
jgi:hypothetical protein